MCGGHGLLVLTPTGCCLFLQHRDTESVTPEIRQLHTDGDGGILPVDASGSSATTGSHTCSGAHRMYCCWTCDLRCWWQDVGQLDAGHLVSTGVVGELPDGTVLDAKLVCTAISEEFQPTHVDCKKKTHTTIQTHCLSWKHAHESMHLLSVVVMSGTRRSVSCITCTASCCERLSAPPWTSRQTSADSMYAPQEASACVVAHVLWDVSDQRGQVHDGRCKHNREQLRAFIDKDGAILAAHHPHPDMAPASPPLP